MNDLQRINVTEDVESAFTNVPSPAAPVKAKSFCYLRQDGFSGKPR